MHEGAPSFYTTSVQHTDPWLHVRTNMLNRRKRPAGKADASSKHNAASHDAKKHKMQASGS